MTEAMRKNHRNHVIGSKPKLETSGNHWENQMPLHPSRSRKPAETISKTHGNHATASEQKPETSGNHGKIEETTHSPFGIYKTKGVRGGGSAIEAGVAKGAWWLLRDGKYYLSASCPEGENAVSCVDMRT